MTMGSCSGCFCSFGEDRGLPKSGSKSGEESAANVGDDGAPSSASAANSSANEGMSGPMTPLTSWCSSIPSAPSSYSIPNSSAKSFEPALGSGIKATASSCASEYRPFAASSSSVWARLEPRKDVLDRRPLRVAVCFDDDLRIVEPGVRKREAVAPNTSSSSKEGMEDEKSAMGDGGRS
ncbi:hypothetical protein A0H81_06356 [Grifola frondosa]|uniref:Uncharacterized protein n=1 Tax=Grifola frondosa TaxID=5627 RepID=A0A1C7MF77_GRIFR|nr:hypothetical protein A0H81_06356 [Grifola frondosa]